MSTYKSTTLHNTKLLHQAYLPFSPVLKLLLLIFYPSSQVQVDQILSALQIQ